MDNTEQAILFAKSILKQFKIPEKDMIYFEAVIVRLALFEIPMRDLKIAINDAGNLYHITVQGYENIIDMVDFNNTFLGNSRSMYLGNVVSVLAHMPDRAIILQMEKVLYRKADAGTSNPVDATKRRMKKRTA